MLLSNTTRMVCARTATTQRVELRKPPAVNTLTVLSTPKVYVRTAISVSIIKTKDAPSVLHPAMVPQTTLKFELRGNSLTHSESS
jgi:hypothetical protein